MLLVIKYSTGMLYANDLYVRPSVCPAGFSITHERVDVE